VLNQTIASLFLFHTEPLICQYDQSHLLSSAKTYGVEKGTKMEGWACKLRMRGEISAYQNL
jgi:hypothetical protein